ncbi:hypothetical protein CRUP_011208, partial [Coryphaenoides rupestris]
MEDDTSSTSSTSSLSLPGLACLLHSKTPRLPPLGGVGSPPSPLGPDRVYQWKQLENLYFREKKFAVEVNDPHRRAVTKRTFGQTGLLIHTWYASHSLIKTIWVMAISQHQFYLDRKQSKGKIGSARSLEEIAMDLTEHGGSKISRLGDAALKNNHIMASNGSLVSTGAEEQKRGDQYIPPAAALCGQHEAGCEEIHSE